ILHLSCHAHPRHLLSYPTDALPITSGVSPSIPSAKIGAVHLKNSSPCCGKRARRPARSRQPASSESFACSFLSSRSKRMPSRRRSEEHTSELQSRENLICRLLLE